MITEMFFGFLKGFKPIEALILRNIETSQQILTVHGHQENAINGQFALFTMLSLKFFACFICFWHQKPFESVKNAMKR